MLRQLLPPQWHNLLAGEIVKPYFTQLSSAVKTSYTSATIYPAKENIFRALELCSPNNVKVVIIGQDPYHEPGQADGLAFSVPQQCKTPGSLQHIFQEIELERHLYPNYLPTAEITLFQPNSSTLQTWAEQGVLLLNSTLTVECGKAASHSRLGWQTFTNAIISELNAHSQNIVFLLWGNNAIKKTALIDTTRHLILRSTHPSGLSWGKTSNKEKQCGHLINVSPCGEQKLSNTTFNHQGFGRLRNDSFYGSMHFATCNSYLKYHSQKAIVW